MILHVCIRILISSPTAYNVQHAALEGGLLLAWFTQWSKETYSRD